MTSRRLLLAPLAATLALSACGGGDGEDKPTKQEFAKQANQICADLERAGKDIGSPTSTKEIAAFADKAEKAVDDAAKKLDGLETPSGSDGEKAQKFIDGVKTDTNEKIRPALENLKKAAQDNDRDAIVKAAQELQKVDTSATDQAARDIGATGCAG